MSRRAAPVVMTDEDGRAWTLEPTGLRSEYHPITKAERFYSGPAEPLDEGAFRCVAVSGPRAGDWTHVLDRSSDGRTWCLYARARADDVELRKAAFAFDLPNRAALARI